MRKSRPIRQRHSMLRKGKEGYENHWTVSEICLYLGISKDTFNRYVKNGKYPKHAVRNERGWRLWTKEQVDEMLALRFRL